MVEVAKNATRIAQVDDTQIRQVLSWIFMLLGLRELPDKTQDLVYISYIRNHLFYFTTAEIRLAFELAINNKLDVGLDKIEHYQNFSMMYLEKILQSYGRYRSEKLKKVDESRQLAERNELTEVEKNEKVINGIKLFFEKYKRNENTKLDESFGLMRFKFLWQHKYITSEWLTQERHDAIYERAIIEWKNYLIKCKGEAECRSKNEAVHYSEVLRDFVARCASDSGKTVIGNIAMRISLYEWFDDLIAKQIDINEILK